MKKTRMSADSAIQGVSLADEGPILASLDSLCSRVQKLLDVIQTQVQFTR